MPVWVWFLLDAQASYDAGEGLNASSEVIMQERIAQLKIYSSPHHNGQLAAMASLQHSHRCCRGRFVRRCCRQWSSHAGKFALHFSQPGKWPRLQVPRTERATFHECHCHDLGIVFEASYAGLMRTAWAGGSMIQDDHGAGQS